MAAVTLILPPSQLHSAASQPSLEAGERAFKLCASCHNFDPKGKSGTGPTLYGVFGRTSGTSAYPYSPALKAKKIRWDCKSLDQWLSGPAKMVPGNRMLFGGMRSAEQRRNLLTYLSAAGRGGGKKNAGPC